MQDDIAPLSSDSETAAAARGSAAAEGGVGLDKTERLIGSDKVEGTAVYGRQGSRLCLAFTVMIDKVSGQVAYAMMSFGGFLGIGDRYHPPPWEVLEYDPRWGGYVVEVDRERLERVPSYAADEAPWSDPQYGRSVYGHYGMPCLS